MWLDSIHLKMDKRRLGTVLADGKLVLGDQPLDDSIKTGLPGGGKFDLRGASVNDSFTFENGNGALAFSFEIVKRRPRFN